jgi:hypothetical protein
LSKKNAKAICDHRRSVFLAERRFRGEIVCLIFNFSDRPARVRLRLIEGSWHKLIDSAEHRWMGPGSTVPDSLQISGPAQLEASAQSVVLFSNRRDTQAIR